MMTRIAPPRRPVRPLLGLLAAATLAAAAAAAACSPRTPAEEPAGGAGDTGAAARGADTAAAPATPPGAGDQAAASAAIARLEAEARALVSATGCATAAQCRTAPVGARGCGGPRTYVVYCPLTTDSVALARALARVDSAEKAFNERYQIASTCEMRLPPETALEGGRCTEAPPR